MEEHVGQLWHRVISALASHEHPRAALSLEQMRASCGLVFRALGGDPGLRIEAATATAHGAYRPWLQRLAGGERYVELAWQDELSLRLPARIALYPQQQLNRDLYLWLAALAAMDKGASRSWFSHQQYLVAKVLHAYPGMVSRYRRLVRAELQRRPHPDTLPALQAQQERVLQHALLAPGCCAVLPDAKRPPWPVPVWLHPRPPLSTATPGNSAEPAALPAKPASRQQQRDQRRRRAEYTPMPETENGLLLTRFETILSWAEYTRVNRCTDDENDEDNARRAAEDMDIMSIAQDQSASASRVRFDLDLPAAENDDTPLGAGILLPEWDYKRAQLKTDYCCLQAMVATDAQVHELPLHLQRTARKLRRQFEALRPQRRWFKSEPQGSEIDLDAYIQHLGDKANGQAQADRGLYRDFRGAERDLACLLLADVSLSTDAWVSNSARIIDIIRDSLFLFSEALAATGDDFSVHAFSSRRRDHVRFHLLKSFDEDYDDKVRGRIQAIKPGYYTRMGAAIRHASQLLQQRAANQRLLLLLTDGKPNDLDHYEGRYGIEDTRMALVQARRMGLQPFCVTIDERASDYLPHVFGNDSYVVIRKPSQLPQQLPLLYARLTN